VLSAGRLRSASCGTRVLAESLKCWFMFRVRIACAGQVATPTRDSGLSFGYLDWCSHGLLCRAERVLRHVALLECALLLRPDSKSQVTLLSHEKGVPMAPYLGDGDWRSIAEQTSNEMDPAKLMILVEKLCRALDGERGQKSPLGATSPGNEPGSFSGD